MQTAISCRRMQLLLFAPMHAIAADACTSCPSRRSAQPLYHSRQAGVPYYRNLTALDRDALYTIQATYLFVARDSNPGLSRSL